MTGTRSAHTVRGARGRRGLFARGARALALALGCALAFAAPALAQGAPNLRALEAAAPQNTKPPMLEGVGIVQKMGAQAPLDAVLADEAGNPVKLGDLCNHGRPVVLALVYYECPMLCNQVLNGLLTSMRALTFDAGREYDVVTLSFDARETSELAAKKKAAYLERYARAGGVDGWRFLTGKAPEIKKVADAVGFGFKFDEAKGDFSHGAGVAVLTPDGRVSRWLLGIDYSPRDLRLALVEASEGRVGTVADQALLYCYKYDPASGKYGAAVMNLIRAGGVLTLVLLAAFFIHSARSGRAAGAASAPPPADRMRNSDTVS